MYVGSINIHVKLQSGFLAQFAFLFSSLECNHIDFSIFLSISKSCCTVIKYVIVLGRIMFYTSESIYIRTNVHSNPTNPWKMYEVCCKYVSSKWLNAFGTYLAHDYEPLTYYENKCIIINFLKRKFKHLYFPPCM